MATHLPLAIYTTSLDSTTITAPTLIYIKVGCRQLL